MLPSGTNDITQVLLWFAIKLITRKIIGIYIDVGAI